MKQIFRQWDIDRIKQKIAFSPVTAILGSRQCGKTTLARHLQADHYFDLENPRDIRRMETPQLTLEPLSGLIVIDEIQRQPDLFPLLRYLVDNSDQKYLILGSASRDLIQNGSETLAGRISFHTLGGFGLSDLENPEEWEHLWTRGGFPRSFLADSEKESYMWREDYIRTYLERDIPQLGISIPSSTLRRFWIMLSHYHGNLLNYSELARSFGISDKTVKNYLAILEGTFMIRLLSPWHGNIKKRLVKTPKLLIRDSGIFHTLQTLETKEQLTGHNKLGASWEGFVLEEISRIVGHDNTYFYRTQNGAELDLYWQRGGKSYGVEVKYGDAPGMTKSMHSALNDLNLDRLWIVYPGKESFQINEKVFVSSPNDLLREITVPTL